jgi:DNA segregation ATPase FtsK/SpoIIIE-like protein
MNKAIESKIVLNQPGAETLLGDGDLLFRDIGELTRLQGVWTGPGAA